MKEGGIIKDGYECGCGYATTGKNRRKELACTAGRGRARENWHSEFESEI